MSPATLSAPITSSNPEERSACSGWGGISLSTSVNPPPAPLRARSRRSASPVASSSPTFRMRRTSTRGGRFRVVGEHLGHGPDLRRLGHLPHEQEAGEHHADAERHGERELAGGEGRHLLDLVVFVDVEVVTLEAHHRLAKHRLGRGDHDVRERLAQPAASAHQGAAGAEACDKRIDVGEITDDLGARALVVRKRVALVLVLKEHVVLRVLGRDLLGQAQP